MSLQFALDHLGEDEEGIAVNLLPLTSASMEVNRTGSKCSKVTKMIPHFRLLAISTSKVKNGDLEDVDALLSCPIWLPRSSVIEKMDSLSQMERNVTCASLFYAVNWILGTYLKL